MTTVILVTFLKTFKLPRYMAISTIKHQYMKWQNYLARKRIYISTKSMSKFHLIIIYRWFHHTKALVILQIYFICLTGPSRTTLKGILHIFRLLLKYFEKLCWNHGFVIFPKILLSIIEIN